LGFWERALNMAVKVTAGMLHTVEADAIVVSVFEGVAALAGPAKDVDEALDGAIGDIMDAGDFTGKKEQVAVLYTRSAVPARRVLVVGLGEQADFSLDSVRRAAAVAAHRARDLQVSHMATVLHGIEAGGIEPGAAAQAVVEGTLLGLYQYQQRPDSDAEQPLSLELVVPEDTDTAAVESGAASGVQIAAGVNLARDLVNLPPNICTPAYRCRDGCR
jgi:leucyl aminopeptidase